MGGRNERARTDVRLRASERFWVLFSFFFCCLFGFVFESFWGVILGCFLVTLGSFFALFFVRFLMLLFRESQRHRSILESFFGFVEPKAASK